MNSFLPRVVVIVAFLVAGAFSPSAAREVWCLPEYYRIDPVNGTVAELGHKAVDTAFKTRNAIFEQESRVVHLQAMRGETLAFQIVIEGKSTGVSLEATGFPSALEFFYEGYLPWLDEAAGQVRYTPEVAIPLDWLNGRFDVSSVPPPLPAVPGKRLQAIWVDLPVPRDQPVGTFQGHVRVTGNEGELATVEVIVDVLPLTLPEQPVWLQGMITYSTFGQNYPQREADAWRCMQAHRLSIHEVPYSSQRGYAMSDAIPKTTLSGAFERFDEFRRKATHLSTAERAIYPYEPEIERLRDPARHTVIGEDLQQRFHETMVLHDLMLKECRKLYGEAGAGVTDWTEFDHRYGPLFDGTAFKDGIPVASFELPFNFNWPAPLDRFEIEEPAQSAMFETIWVKVARDLLDHFTEKGWTRTRFFVYFNPKDSGNNLSMWKGDEPTERKDFLSHRYFHTLFEKAFANPGRIKIDHKIEVGHWECDAGFCRKRDQVEKTWDESDARSLLRDFRVWVCNSRHYQSAREVAWKQMADQDDEFFTYEERLSRFSVGALRRKFAGYSVDSWKIPC